MPKTATFDTNLGTITAELYDKDAPATVANFEKLANSGFYDGVKFHRVIADFVVQGGDPLSRDLPAGHAKIGTGGPGWMIKCETVGNPRKHEVGALSMAHAGKDTGGPSGDAPGPRDCMESRLARISLKKVFGYRGLPKLRFGRQLFVEGHPGVRHG